MACTTETKTIVLEAARVSWGKEDKNCVTPAAGLTGGEYFEISSQDTEYYVWTDINNASVDPAPAGKTAIEVDVPTAYTVADWITAFITAAEASGDFFAEASSDGLSVKVETVKVGAVVSALADVDTSFTFESLQAGIGGDLGKTKEGIEISYEATLFDVKSNQTGELLLDQIIQGTNASATMSLLEVTKEKLGLIFGEGYGDKYTPAGGTEVVGFGSSKNFTSSFDSAGKLILHPVRLADSDRSEDVVFHKCVPLPESINYDGTDTKALSVSFNALVDESKASEVSLFAIGDWQQDLRA
jgi:hypothetical protein